MIALKKILYPLLILCCCLFVIPSAIAQVGYEEPDYEEIPEEEPVPQILGAYPVDGASNLIRNAIVSARMELLDRYQGVDANSASEKSIRLYAASKPNEIIETYVTINNDLKNILLEPSEVLEPNTEYVFEITPDLRDLEGVAFEGFRSKFKTGSVSLPKRISKRKPRFKVIEKKKPVRLNPLPEGYLLKKKKTAKEKPAPPVANSEPTTGESVEASKAAEEQKKLADSPSKPVEKLPEPVKIPTKNDINYTNQYVRQNRPLPVTFSVVKDTEIRYLIKNEAGEIVKKGIGKVEQGIHDKSIPTTDLEPGNYKLAIKMEDLVKNHRFQILK